METGRAQPVNETWVHPHVGPAPTGGAVEVHCESGGNQRQAPVTETDYWDMERHLSDGEET